MVSRVDASSFCMTAPCSTFAFNSARRCSGTTGVTNPLTVGDTDAGSVNEVDRPSEAYASDKGDNFFFTSTGWNPAVLSTSIAGAAGATGAAGAAGALPTMRLNLS